MQEEGLAKEFIRQGHACSLVYYSGKKEYWTEEVSFDEDKKFLIHWIPSIKIYDNCLFNKKILDPLIKQADIVLTEEFNQVESCLLALRYPLKTVIYHGPYRWPEAARPKKTGSAFGAAYGKRVLRKIIGRIYQAIFLKRMLQKNTVFVTKSNLAKDEIALKGFRNVQVIPVGLDLEKFIGYTDTGPRLFNQTVLPLLYVGVLHDRRNITFMLKLVRQLRDAGIPVVLQLVGTGADKYVDECKYLCRELDIEGYVTFSGQVDQSSLPQIYQAHPVFLLPSKHEIFGMVMLEAMFFGSIVLTTFHGGSDMVIQNGVNGFILPENDLARWSQALVKIYGEEYDSQKISRNARITVSSNYTWEKSAMQFIDIFEKKLLVNR